MSPVSRVSLSSGAAPPVSSSIRVLRLLLLSQRLSRILLFTALEFQSTMSALARMMLLLMSMFFGAVSAEDAADDPGAVDEYLDGAEADTTILFPWFTEALGIFVFFVSHLREYFLRIARHGL